MNETIKTIMERRAIRGYEDKMPEKADIELIVQCGQYAPSARGMQAWHFTVLRDRALMKQCSDATRDSLLASPVEAMRKMAQDCTFDTWRGAPMAIILSTQDGSAYSLADCANAIENMALAAQSIGLSTCYLGSFKLGMLAPGNELLLRELKIPAGYTPALALAIGYGNKEPDPRAPRRADSVDWIG